MLLKVVLFAYSQGIVSSRGIEARLPRARHLHRPVAATARRTSPRSPPSSPAWATKSPASFAPDPLPVRPARIDRPRDVRHRRRQAAEQCLEAEERHPCRLPAPSRSYEAAARAMLARHRENDSLPVEADLDAKASQRIARLHRDAAELRDWLTSIPRIAKAPKAASRKSNRTDNESAKMATGKGVIQGYTGVAAVDAKHQIIVEAQAHGTGSEQDLLLPVVKAIGTHWTTRIAQPDPHHRRCRLPLRGQPQALAGRSTQALIADNGMRQARSSASRIRPSTSSCPIRSTTRAHQTRRAGWPSTDPRTSTTTRSRHLRLPGRQAALPQRQRTASTTATSQ